MVPQLYKASTFPIGAVAKSHTDALCNTHRHSQIAA